MNKLIKIVKNLKKSPIKKVVDKRIKEFEKLGRKNSNELFKELCFCIMTANFNAEKSIKIQNEINNNFLSLSENKLSKKLSELGHRFPNLRAKFIFKSQKYKDNLKKIFNSLKTEKIKREWLVKNIKGLGYKEASHFLRNIGYKNISIIDFHIIDLLVKNNLIKPLKNKSLTSKKYLEIEKILKKIAEKTNTNLGELDLYLWYEETGKVLK